MRKLFIPAFLLGTLLAENLCAQTTTVSPYSRFGFGDLQFKGYAENTAMGGTAISLRPATSINSINPASCTSLTLTTFEAGGSAQFLKTSNAVSSEKTKNSSFSYLALGFPVTKYWGTSLGIHPYSSVGYDISAQETLDSIGTATYNYIGNGNLNEVYWGNGVKIYKGLSVGINASYIFGNIQRIRNAEITGSYYWMSHVTNSLQVGGFRFQAGLQYEKVLKNEWNLIVGATGAIGENVKAKSTNLLEIQQKDGFGNPYTVDSAGNTHATYGSIRIPGELGLGLSLYNKRWTVAAEYITQNWSNYSAFSNTDILVNSSQISLGAQLTPDDQAFAKYYKRIHYRIGLKLANTYISIPGSGQVKENLISVGAGFPVSKSGTVLNTALEAGVRGSKSSGQIQEDFIRITIGFNFNDKWFIKNKFD